MVKNNKDREKERAIDERLSTFDQISFALEYYRSYLPADTLTLTRTPIEISKNKFGKKVKLSRSIVPWRVDAYVETEEKNLVKKEVKDKDFYAAMRERVAAEVMV